MAQDPQAQAQQTLQQSHQIAQAAGAMHGQGLAKMHQQIMAAPQQHSEIMDALNRLQQGQQPAGLGGQPGSQGSGLPDPVQLVQQDPASAAAYADAILEALAQMLQSQGAPQRPSVPVAPPNVGGAVSGF